MFKNNFLNLLSIMMLQKFTIERIANDVKYIRASQLPEKKNTEYIGLSTINIKL